MIYAATAALIAAELDSINQRIAWLEADAGAPAGVYSMLHQLKQRALFLEGELQRERARAAIKQETSHELR